MTESWKCFLDSCFNDNKGVDFVRIVKVIINSSCGCRNRTQDRGVARNLWHNKYLDKNECLTSVGLAQTVNSVKYPGEPNLKEIYCLWDEKQCQITVNCVQRQKMF